MRDYALTALVFALLPVCLVRPWLGILAWYWIGLMNPHRLTWGFAYTMPFAMLVAGATLLGAVFAKDRRPIPWSREMVLMAGLLLYFTVTTFYAWAPTFAWAQWEKVAKVIFMTFVATMFIYGKTRIRALMFVVVASIGFYGVKGGIWSILRGGAGQVQGPEGSFIDGNTFLGLALNMVVPMMVALARDEERPWLRRLLYAAAALSVVASLFTYSRGAWLGLAVVVPLVLLQLKAVSRVVIVGGLALAAVFATAILPEKVFQRADTIASYEEDGSANQRLESWSVAWNVAKDRPFVGAGFEFEQAGGDRWLDYGSEEYRKFMIAANKDSAAAHSIYFQVLGQHGFVAFFIYCTLLASVCLTLLRVRAKGRESPETTWTSTYATGLLIGLFGYLVSGAFLSSAYFDLAWLYFALAAVLMRELTAKAPSPAGEATALASVR
jgi:probable O-glycosylation ligase (exosortase A-associated)